MEQKIFSMQNKGMVRDTSISKSSNEFAYENFNIRITPRDHDTLLSVTNERGNTPIEVIRGEMFSSKPIGLKIIWEADKDIYTIRGDWSVIPKNTRITFDIHFSLSNIGGGDISEPIEVRRSLFYTGNAEIPFEEDTDYSKGKVPGYNRNYITEVGPVIRYKETQNALIYIDLDIIVAKEFPAYTKMYIYRHNMNIVNTDIENIKKTQLTIEGNLIGYNVLNSYLTLFTTSKDGDRIYSILYKPEDESWNGRLLYQGKLNFSIEYPIETIGLYESEDIQKVYWVDGKNQPRFINIKKYYTLRKDTQFDFLTSFESTLKVNIKKLYDVASVFPAGTVQYFFTYSNKFGQETSIVYKTPLYYNSNNEVGAGEDTRTSSVYTINISDADSSFDYLNIYSLVNGNQLRKLKSISTKGELSVYDIGTEGESIAVTDLFFKGGKNIIAETFGHKDNVLFLGNLHIKNAVLDEDLHKVILDSKDNLSFVYSTQKDSLKLKSNDSVYDYENQLENNSKEICFFKTNEVYRFGIVFFTPTGERSPVYYIGDLKNTLYPRTEGDTVERAVINYNMTKTVADKALSLGYTGCILVRALANPEDRSVLTQGVICPTVFNIKDRVTETSFSNSSWFFRLENSNLTNEHLKNIGDSGSDVEFLKSDNSNAAQSVLNRNRYSEFQFSQKAYPLCPLNLAFSPEDVKKLGLYNRIIIETWTKYGTDIGNTWCSMFFRYSFYYVDKEGNSTYVFSKDSKSFRDDAFWGKVENRFKVVYPQLLTSVVSDPEITKYNIPIDAYPKQHEVWSWIDRFGGNHGDYFRISGSRIGDVVVGYEPVINREVLQSDNIGYTYALGLPYSFFTDNSIVTFNYPGNEAYNFNTLEGYKLRIVGYAELENSQTDLDFKLDVEQGSFYNKWPYNTQIKGIDNLNVYEYPSTFPSLTSYTTIDNVPGEVAFQIYPWHKEKSITDKVKIKSKTLANMRFCKTTKYFSSLKEIIEFPATAEGEFTFIDYEYEKNVDNIYYINSDSKIIGYDGKQIIYYSNPQYIIAPGNNTYKVLGSKTGYITDMEGLFNSFVNISQSSDPINVSYKSTPHFVITYKGDQYNQHVRSSFKEIYSINNSKEEQVFPWLPFNELPEYRNYDLNYYISYNPYAVPEKPHLKVINPIQLFNAIKVFPDSIHWVNTYNDDFGRKFSNIAILIDPFRLYKSIPHGKIDLYATENKDKTLTFTLSHTAIDEEYYIMKVSLYSYSENSEVLISSELLPTLLFDRTITITDIGDYNIQYRLVIEALNKEDDTEGFYTIFDDVFLISTPTKGQLIDTAIHLVETGLVLEDDEDKLSNIEVILVSNAKVTADNAAPFYIINNKIEQTNENRATINQHILAYDKSQYQELLKSDKPRVIIGELYRDIPESQLYGGTDENALESNVFVDTNNEITLINSELSEYVTQNITGYIGDSYFQRYDFVKTLPFDKESRNNVIEILSCMIECSFNSAGRTDNGIGAKDYTLVNYDNFNTINRQYTATDTIPTSQILDLKYSLRDYPSQYTWTEPKIFTEETDIWTKINLTSVQNLDGDKGPIRAIRRFQNNLIAFQDKGLVEILYNTRTQLATTQGVPIEIANSQKVDGNRYITDKAGCINKWSIVETSTGIYFIDNINSSISRYNGQFQSLSDIKGFRDWIGNNNSLKPWYPKITDGKEEDGYANFVAYWDRINDDVYFLRGGSVKNQNTLCYNELLEQFTSFFDYGNVPMMANVQNRFISFKDGKLWLQNEGKYGEIYNNPQPYYMTYRVTPDPYGDKIFTNIDYRADIFDMESFKKHPYMPLEGTLTDHTFDRLYVWNEYQGNDVPLNKKTRDRYPDVRNKFRVWRADIPRDKYKPLNRIRNPWIYLKLEKIPEEGTNERMEFHNLNVKYFE